jgi:DNA-binding IscR family transcriptional regulator
MSTDTPIEKYLKSSGSKGVKILLWLLKHRDKDNVLVITLDYVAADNNVTKVTVNRVFQKLYADKFLVKIRNGQYRLINV